MSRFVPRLSNAGFVALLSRLGRRMNPAHDNHAAHRLPPARSSVWPAAIGGALMILGLVLLPGDSGSETTYTLPFAVSEDTFIKSTRSTLNYGHDTTLQADASPSIKRSLLRFNVSGIPSTATISGATLRLYVVGRSKFAGSLHQVDGAWDEHTTTWAQAPKVGALVGTMLGGASAGTWNETNVTSMVTGNGAVNLYLLTSSSDGVDYASRDQGAHPPTLVVQWSVPAPPPPPPTPATPVPTPTRVPIGASGTTYYVDSVSGNDANSGTGESSAWRTLGRASSANLAPGERLLFKRGASWSGTLTMAESGTATQAIIVGAYGSGAPPVIEGGSECVALTGAYVRLSELRLNNCAWAGVKISAGAHHNRVEGNEITLNAAGVHVASGASDNQVVGNTIRDNNKMSVLTASPNNDDSGAFGILLNGDRNDVSRNTISGSDAFSYDYGRDGAAVEVYGGQQNHVHHNLAVDNRSFSELGNARSSDNTFAYNVVHSALADSIFLVTRGSASSYGPVANTRLYNNTVLMTGAGSQGFVCHAGCSGSVLIMRNNIIKAVAKAGYADGPFDEDYDLFHGGQMQFAAGPHSLFTDPSFANPGAGDVHVTPGSPAVDSGIDTGYAVDFDGAGVPQDGNGDGVAATNRGAFEGVAGPPVVATPTAVVTAAVTATPPPPPPPSGDAVLVGAGDISGCDTNGDEQTAQLLDSIPGTVFTLGDNVYPDGTPQQFADCYNPSWGRHKDRTRPATGNHDYHQAGAPGYYGYFGDAATPLEPGCRSSCKGYYSYNAGAWHVVVMNSECSAAQACDKGEMEQWLRNDLAANRTACTVAMWHAPVLTIGPHNNDEEGMKTVWQILYDNNAELVLNGHEHSYARYAPLNRDATGVDNARGMRQIVVGTGGKGLTTSSRAGSTPGLEVWQDGSNANALGVIKLTLRSGGFDWQFVPVAGKSFTDSGSGTCH